MDTLCHMLYKFPNTLPFHLFKIFWNRQNTFSHSGLSTFPLRSLPLILCLKRYYPFTYQILLLFYWKACNFDKSVSHSVYSHDPSDWALELYPHNLTLNSTLVTGIHLFSRNKMNKESAVAARTHRGVFQRTSQWAWCWQEVGPELLWKEQVTFNATLQD